MSNRTGNTLRAISLDAIRGFECAARHLSFTSAADELCITQSAVSKQVKGLEQALGVALFARGGKGLSLTPQGHELYQSARAAFEHLGTTVERLAGPERISVSITTTPSFAALWLVPNLARFQALHPGIDVRVDASEATVNLDRVGMDLAVRLSAAAPEENAPAPLLQERLMLVAAPAIAARIDAPAALRDVPLLVYYDPAGLFPWMSWTQWLARLGLDRSARQPCLYFSEYGHVLEAAAQGAGVAIGRSPLVLPFLKARRLQVALPACQAPGMTYRIVTSVTGQSRHGVTQLRNWLERELAREVLG